MLKIRLKRVGRRNDPSFRVVVVESHQGPKSNKAVETLGFYNPKTKEREVKADRVKHWISSGAQPSDTVWNLLIELKIIEGVKKNVLPKKSPVKKEEAATTEAVAPASDKEASGSAESTEASQEEQSSEESEKTEVQEPVAAQEEQAPKEAVETSKPKGETKAEPDNS